MTVVCRWQCRSLFLLQTNQEQFSVNNMKEQLGYKYRIYPDANQERLFRRTAGCCRFLYNLFLEQKKLEWGRSTPRRLTQIDQIKQIPEAKGHFPFLREVGRRSDMEIVIEAVVSADDVVWPMVVGMWSSGEGEARLDSRASVTIKEIRSRSGDPVREDLWGVEHSLRPTRTVATP